MAINLVQVSPLSTMLFSTGTWVPATAKLPAVKAGNLVLSLQARWSIADQGVPQHVPTDTNGTLTGAGNANPNPPGGTPVPGWPISPGICYIASAAAGDHVMTPLVNGGGDDGYFFAAEFACTSPCTWSLVDSGFAFASSGTAGGVQTLTVSTAGANAKVGDLVVVALCTDGDPTAQEQGPPGGYNYLLATQTTLDNISAGMGWKTCTAAGTQTQVWTWSDTATQVAQGVVAVFRPTVVPGTSVPPALPVRRAPSGGFLRNFDIRRWW